MKQVVLNVKSYLKECENLNKQPQIELNSIYEVVDILRHERNDLYNIRLKSKKNLMSVNSKHIEIKEL